jgi:phosphate transport system protein
MQRFFHEELEDLKILTLRMAAAAQRAVSKALEAFFERNSTLAEEVIDGDHEINSMELEIDRSSIRLLALEQPVARDLRFIVVTRRMNIDLERIADQAVSVARKAVYLSHRPPLPAFAPIQVLADQAEAMLKLSIQAFSKADVDLARQVVDMDDVADQKHVELLKAVIQYMLTESPSIERCLQIIFAARSLERIADLSTNIAENTIFLVEGVNVKHLKSGAAVQKKLGQI